MPACWLVHPPCNAAMLIAAQVHSLQHHSVSAIPDLYWICAANISATMLAASRRGVGTRVDAHLVQVQFCQHGRHLQPTAAAAAAHTAHCLLQPWRRRQLTALMGRQRQRSLSRRSRTAAPRAMVNVDFSPALILGLGMVAGGVLLYNVRINRPYISRDYDVVISSISVLVGGILIFQGWRLDPLLLFGQLLTAGTATAFALEVFRLRESLAVRESRTEDQSEVGRWTPAQTGGRSLPQPAEQQQFQRWSGTDEQQQQQPQERWQPTYYDGSQGDRYAEEQDGYRDDDAYSTPQEQQRPAEYGSGPADQELGSGRNDDGSSQRGRSGSRQGSGWGRPRDYDAVEDW